MKTNITFVSNVYPIDGAVHSDKQFLSQIKDYAKLKELNEKFFSYNRYSFLSEFQRKIIKEGLICSYAENDPCWGMTVFQGIYSWECRCVNKECKYFKKCRGSFNEKEYNLFSPKINILKGYDYECNYDLQEIFPIKEDYDETFYNSEEYCDKKETCTIIEDEEIIEQEQVNVLEVLTKSEVDAESKDIEQDTVLINEKRLIENETNNEDETFDYYEKDILSTDIPSNIFDSFIDTTQEEIIGARANEIIFVDAGPGTGKTYVLIEKINYMVTEDDVDAESILVLCFTNAAVDEIKSRLNEYVKSGGHRALKNVDVRTFHSFSWWLISQANEIFLEQGWGKTALQNLNYETSLSCASEIIRRFSDDIVENWGHFIVDEVQDLTNSLARFVLYIINACLEKNCGITVLGDSCQAIYDYTQENTISPLISTDFYKCLYRKLYGKAKFFKLEINHRQTSELLQITKLFRQSIIEQNLRNMADEVYNLNESITELKNDLLTIGEQELNRIRNRGKICLMCRNNGQTLRLSSTLRKRQIPHVLNTHETKDNYTPWISKIFFEYPHTNISFDNFKILYEHVKTSVDNCAAEEIWDKFQTLMNTDNENLVISELLQAIKISKIDDPVLRLNSRGAIIVSNIHRSKGREYECVIVDKSFINSLIDEEKNIGEYKTLYVAVTRPKKRLYSASLSKPGDLRSITIYDSKRKRWGKARGKRIIYFEIKSDIDIDVNSYLTVNSGQAQQYLDNVHEGDPIILKRNIRNGKVNYDVIHCLNDTETTIGRIKSSYVDDLYSYIRPEKAVNMPAFIDELYVSSVYTHIADDETLRLYPELKKLAPNKVWRWVEFVGLGHANYDTY